MTITEIDLPDTAAPEAYDDQPLALDIVMAALDESADELDPSVHASLGEMDLPETLELMADLDSLIERAQRARDMALAHADTRKGWKSNRVAFPGQGLRAERTRSSRRSWDNLRVVGRLAQLFSTDEVTGEIFTDNKTAERVARRVLDFGSLSGWRSTALDEHLVEYDDLLTKTPGSTRMKVFRETPAETS